MKTCIILCAILLMASSMAYTQQAKPVEAKPRFSSILQGGLISGDQSESSLIQTINGWRKDKWFAGVGAGIDFYHERGVPLFIDIRRDLSDKKHTPFIYGDGGINFEWLNFVQKEQRGLPKSSAGLYYDIGAGWKLKGRNNGGLILSAGYSFKQAKERSLMQTYNPILFTSQQTYQYMDYRYRRVVIKVGFQLQ